LLLADRMQQNIVSKQKSYRNSAGYPAKEQRHETG
jgi:hypothetical protein